MSKNHPDNLRQRALELLKGKPIDAGEMEPGEIERLLHELQLHEIELRLQNEELRAAQQQLEESHRKYADLYDFAPVGYLTLNQKGLVQEANLTVTKMLDAGREQLFSRPFSAYLVPPHRSKFVAHQQRLFETQEPQRDEVLLEKADGQRFYAQIDSTLMESSQGQPAHWHMVLTDIDQRKQAEAAEHEQRVFAEALRVIGNALNQTLDLDEVLSLILDNVNYVVQHDVAEVMLFEDGVAKVVDSKGYNRHERRAIVDLMELPIDAAFNLSEMMQSRAPVVVPDVRTVKGWIEQVSNRKLRAYVGAPIMIDDRVIGCLNVFNAVPGFYDDRHAERLQAFASQTATAIKNAQLYERAQEVATMQERHRLARDLHDAVSQTLFSATMIAEALPRLIERNPGVLASNLDNLLLLTRGAMAEMRSLLLELRPGALERYTLTELLLQLAEALQGRKQMQVQLELGDEPSIAADVKEALYRIAQEALNNVIRHSQATEVSIKVDGSPDHLELAIRDNGRGFEPAQVQSGIGLQSMDERAHAVGAELVVDSAPDQGTAITLVWPRSA